MTAIRDGDDQSLSTSLATSKMRIHATDLFSQEVYIAYRYNQQEHFRPAPVDCQGDF
jgi:hypothetical protein